jgi:hypothetical protein
VHQSLLSVLRILEHHYVIIALCIAVLLALAAVILSIRKGGLFRGRHRRHHSRPTIPTGPVTAGEGAQALLSTWANDNARLSYRVESARPTAGVGPASPHTSSVPLRLVQNSARVTAASSASSKEVLVEPTEIDQLLKLGDLFERNLLTRQEFEEEKRLLREHYSTRAARSSTTSRSSEIDAGSSSGQPGRE